MRLIDADMLLKLIERDKAFLQKGLGKDAEYAYMTADSVIAKINSCPTVYPKQEQCNRR